MPAHFTRRFALAAVVLTLAGHALVAQMPADEAALQKAAAIKDPEACTEALIAVVRDYPQAVYIRNVVYYLTRVVRPLSAEPERARKLIDRFVDGTSSATAYARNEFYYGIARDLTAAGMLPDRALDLAKRAVALLNDRDYLDNERRTHDQREAYYNSKDPKRTPEPYSPAEATEKFRAFRASNYATLGRAFFKLGRMDDAERAYGRAYAIKPTVEGATGLADIAEARGDQKTTLEHLSDAMLTGRMTADGIARLHALYRALHGGSLDGFERDLDARYRRTFANPIAVEPYRATAARASNGMPRAVLVEFITGAGCEPCTAVDLAFSAALERYSRGEFVLIVYPMHAPTSDPMSNPSAQARHKFYGANGAPTSFLDGQPFPTGEGLATEAARVWSNVRAGIEKRLDVAADAHLTLAASRSGAIVSVQAAADIVAAGRTNLRLHLALVEDDVSYSGENGLRFHPMVVRALAQPAGASGQGFAVTGSGAHADYAFDLDKITAANLAYYDEYLADLKKRTSIQATFKEQRHVMDPSRLSVVAFLQDDATKQILQSAFVKAVVK